MLKEALEYLRSLNSDATRLTKLHEDPRQVIYDQRGDTLVVPLPVPPRNHAVETIESFGAAVAYTENVDAAVWVTLTQAVAVLDNANDAHRVHRITLPVAPSPFFAVLESQNWCEQKRLIDVLRHDLAGAEIDPTDTLSLLRNLRFATQSEQVGTYDATSAKLGKQVAAQVTGESKLPEVVSVEFHPYPQLAVEVDSTVVVMCTLFADAATARLKLAPQPGQLAEAKTNATRALLAAVKREVGDVPAFCGTP